MTSTSSPHSILTPEMITDFRQRFYNNDGKASDDPIELALSAWLSRWFVLSDVAILNIHNHRHAVWFPPTTSPPHGTYTMLYELRPATESVIPPQSLQSSLMKYNQETPTEEAKNNA